MSAAAGVAVGSMLDERLLLALDGPDIQWESCSGLAVAEIDGEGAGQATRPRPVQPRLSVDSPRSLCASDIAGLPASTLRKR